MSREEAIEELKSLQSPGDPEYSHSRGDDILCELLIQAGYGDVVAEWKKVEKWYA